MENYKVFASDSEAISKILPRFGGLLRRFASRNDKSFHFTKIKILNTKRIKLFNGKEINLGKHKEN